MVLRLKNNSISIVVASSWTQKMRGLMGVSPITYGLLIPNCNSIHTYFMKESIDVVGLNEQNQVIYIYTNLPKNQIIKIPNPITRTSILELPKFFSKDIHLGSLLFFEDKDVF